MSYLKHFLFAAIILSLSNLVQSQTIDVNDPIVIYDPDNPPTKPPWGTISKWVITPGVSWDTEKWKSYYYNGVPFRLRFPNNYNPNRAEKYPLIVLLHGRGFTNGTIYMNDRHLNNAGADAFEKGINRGDLDAFVMSPQGNDGYFGDGHFSSISSAIRIVTQQAHVDINKISLNGRSAGAQASWRFMQSYPKVFSAVLPMSGASNSSIDNVNSYKYISVWLFQGELDGNPTTFTSENLIRDIADQGGSIRYTVYKNSGHGIFDKGYRDNEFFSFMANSNKANPHVTTGDLILTKDNNSVYVYEFLSKTEFCPDESPNATLGLTPGFEAYEWRKNGNVISGANSNSITIDSYGTYDARFKRNGVWSDWSPQPITVKEKIPTETPPIELYVEASKVIPALDGKNFVELSLPEGYSSYEWTYVNTGNIVSTNRVFSASSPGEYVASVTEPFGCSSNYSDPFLVVDANGNNAPDKPIGLTGFAPSKTTITLNWSDNPTPQYNETGFEVYRGEVSGGPYSFIKLIPQDSLSYLDQGLIPDKNYYYIIRAVNNNGASASTNEFLVKTQVDNISPTAPLNLKALETTANSVTLKWDESTDDVGIKRYNIYKDGLKSVISTSNSATVYNLIENNIYQFTVKAEDLSGNESAASNQITVAATFTENAQVNLRFNGNLDDESGSNTESNGNNGIQYNNVTVKEGSHSLYLNGGSYIDLDTKNQFIHTKFTERSVLFWMKPDNHLSKEDIFDEGGTTNGLAVRLNNGKIEFAVQDNQDINTISADITDNNWHHIAAIFNNGEMSLYVDGSLASSKSGLNYAEVSDHGDGAGLGGVSGGGNAFDENSNYYNGFIDNFYIFGKALNTSSVISLMNDNQFEIPDQIPNAPSQINAIPMSYNQIEIEWQDNSTDEIGFQIYRSKGNDNIFYPVAITEPNVINYLDSGLQAETTYHYKVVALGEYGQSEESGGFISIANFKFDGNLEDASSNEITVNAINDPTFNTSQFKQGLSSIYFNGNSYLDLDLNNVFIHNRFSARSISFWLKADDVNGIYDVYDEGGATNGFGIRINNGNIEFVVQNKHVIELISTLYIDTDWHHVAAIFDNGNIRLYLDGSLVASKDNLSFNEVDGHGNDGGLGGTSGNSNAFDQVNNSFKGYIDDFFAFESAIGEAFINELITLSQSQSFTTTLPLPTPPAAPSGLIANAETSSSIILSWSDNSNSEKKFEVYRSSTNNVNFLLLKELDVNTTTFLDIELFANVTYFYKVIAKNVGGSNSSEEVSVKTLNDPPIISELPDVTITFDKEYSINLFASDPNSDSIHFSVENLPSFGTLVDYGDGSGVINLLPSASDEGVYNDIIVFAHDRFEGEAKDTIKIIVSNNNQPSISSVDDITLNEGDSILIPLQGTDADGTEGLVWTITPELPFIKFNAQIDGLAEIVVTPAFSDGGIYEIQITLEDGDGGSDSEIIFLNVIEQNPNKKIFVNISHTLNASQWNNVSSLNTNNLIYDDGTTSNVSVSFQTNWWKTFNDGAITGNNSGVYPDNVLKDYYYFGIFGGPNTVQVKISGLDVQRLYNFELLANSVWGQVSDNGNTIFEIGGQSISLHVQNNTSNLAKLNNIFPDENGDVIINMSKDNNASVGYLNAFTIESVYMDGTIPAAPRNFEIVNDGKPELKWYDAPFNETGFEVFRSESDSLNFELIKTLPSNSISYIDNSVVDGTNYYYKIRSFNTYGASDFTQTIFVPIDDNPPTISLINNLEIFTNVETKIDIIASDPPNNLITLQANNLPSFATLNDLGNGIGEIVFNPTDNDKGIYANIEIIATDNNGASSNELISLTVVEEVLYKVMINFTKNNIASSPWNNTAKDPVTNDVFSNFLNDKNQGTSVGIKLLTNFGGSYNKGAITGDNTGIVPDEVLKEYYWFGIFGAPETVKFEVNGLDLDKKYNFKFIGSSVFSGSGITDNGETVYKIGSKQAALDVQANTQNMAIINNISPDSQGKVIIDIFKGNNAQVGYINGLIIEAINPAINAFTPSDLNASGISKTEISLSWTDNSVNELGFQLFRSETLNGNYSLIGETNTDQSSYIDNGLSAGSQYFYKVKTKFSTDSLSDFSNAAFGATVLFKVFINMNGDPIYNQGVPWNNFGILPGDNMIYSGFKDENGNETGLQMNFIKTFDGSNDWGTSTGDNSGLYPDNVLKSFFFLDALNVANLSLEGLDQSFKYNLEFFGAIETGFQIYANFTVADKTVTHYQTYNTTTPARINDIKPNDNNAIPIDIVSAPGSNWAIFNSLIIEAVPSTSNFNARTNKISQEGFNKVIYGLQDISMNAYPNPFYEDILLRFSDIPKGELEISVHDLLGNEFTRKIYKVTPDSEIKLDLGDLTNGIYIIKSTINNSEIGVQKIIKK